VTRRPFAVVSGGGTGGHVFESLAIARALVELGHDPGSIELVGSRRGQEAALLDGEGFPYRLLPGRGIVRRFDTAALGVNLGALIGLLWATGRELVDFARRRPRVVVSVGGYASFPADVAAVILGVPLVLVTIDAVPGAVHRLLAGRAAANAVAFEGTGLPRATVTGVAVRREICALARTAGAARQARQELELPEGRRVVVVMGGSLGARSINVAALDLAGHWIGREDVAIYHVSGRRDADEVGREAVSRHLIGRDRGLCYRLVSFEHRMPRLYEAADVVVCRAGAGTVAELTVAGVPSVLVPLPGAPGDHQGANARALARAGAAMVLPDPECSGSRLASVLDELLGDPTRLAEMASAARRLGKPHAAERIAKLVVAHAR